MNMFHLLSYLIVLCVVAPPKLHTASASSPVKETLCAPEIIDINPLRAQLAELINRKAELLIAYNANPLKLLFDKLRCMTIEKTNLTSKFNELNERASLTKIAARNTGNKKSRVEQELDDLKVVEGKLDAEILKLNSDINSNANAQAKADYQKAEEKIKEHDAQIRDKTAEIEKLERANVASKRQSKQQSAQSKLPDVSANDNTSAGRGSKETKSEKQKLVDNKPIIDPKLIEELTPYDPEVIEVLTSKRLLYIELTKVNLVKQLELLQAALINIDTKLLKYVDMPLTVLKMHGGVHLTLLVYKITLLKSKKDILTKRRAEPDDILQVIEELIYTLTRTIQIEELIYTDLLEIRKAKLLIDRAFVLIQKIDILIYQADSHDKILETVEKLIPEVTRAIPLCIKIGTPESDIITLMKKKADVLFYKASTLDKSSEATLSAFQEAETAYNDLISILSKSYDQTDIQRHLSIIQNKIKNLP